ncbi:MAG: FKBP-type peptidyl-prolyl cis-trans isomerase [Lachnospiraceae bacterium]|nr:FKBP-type peptidyl-prolyl cis-trans isomerase [Lachnospiraceae bacterium]
MSSDKREAQKKNREKAIQKAKTTKTIKWIVIIVVIASVLGLVGWAVASSIVINTPSVSDYSAGLNEDGTIAGIKATDYVDLFDYKNINVSKSEISISDEEMQSQIDSLIAQYPDNDSDPSRKIKDGDVINLDYVGSIDGVPFDGGSTGGAGTTLTIGSGQYIDGFESAIIGHNVGENFDINVTFPEDYGSTDLAGKPAVFNITVNSVQVPAEFDDAFVAAHLSDVATTVEGYKQYYKDEMLKENLMVYLTNYVKDNATVKDYPKNYLKVVKGQLKYSDEQMYEQYKQSLGDSYTFESFIGMSKKEYEASLTTKAQNALDDNLKFQAIFEDAGLTVTEDDIRELLDEYGLDSTYYSVYEQTYGKPYLYQTGMSYTVIKYLVDTCTITE